MVVKLISLSLSLSLSQLLFFHGNKSFVNIHDPETGNTALHLSSRHGHFVSMHTHACWNSIISLNDHNLSSSASISINFVTF